jgi:hypothetical protein
VLAANPRAWLSVCADAGLVAPLVLWQLRLDAGSLGAVLAGFVMMKAAGVVGSRLIAGRTIPGRTLPGLVAVNMVAIIVFAMSEVSVIVIIAFGLHVVAHIAISVYCAAQFQSVVPDDRRAGAGSLVSLLSSFVMGGAAVLVGFLADRYGPLIAVVPSLVLYTGVAALGMFGRDNSTDHARIAEAGRAESGSRAG